MIDAIIREELTRLINAKGLAPPAEITDDMAFLDGALPIDSLDLASLLVVLERRTGRDPFRQAFQQFATVGQLAALYEA